jgi:disulfide bond formation protein DsbB
MTTRTTSKQIICTLLKSPQGLSFTLLNVSLFALLFAFLAEYLWYVKPCVLCIYQRYVFLGLGIFSFIGLLVKVKRFFLLYIGITLIGLFISGYHIGVEEHWWKGPDACSADAPKTNQNLSQADQIKAFREKLKKKSSQVVRCDEVNWRILGVSATIWTFLLHLGILGYIVVANKKGE